MHCSGSFQSGRPIRSPMRVFLGGPERPLRHAEPTTERSRSASPKRHFRRRHRRVSTGMRVAAGRRIERRLLRGAVAGAESKLESDVRFRAETTPAPTAALGFLTNETYVNVGSSRPRACGPSIHRFDPGSGTLVLDDLGLRTRRGMDSRVLATRPMSEASTEAIELHPNAAPGFDPANHEPPVRSRSSSTRSRLLSPRWCGHAGSNSTSRKWRPTQWSIPRSPVGCGVSAPRFPVPKPDGHAARAVVSTFGARLGPPEYDRPPAFDPYVMPRSTSGRHSSNVTRLPAPARTGMLGHRLRAVAICRLMRRSARLHLGGTPAGSGSSTCTHRSRATARFCGGHSSEARRSRLACSI